MEEKEVKELADTIAEVIGRLCVVLRTRGIITKYDQDYITSQLTPEEWAVKHKEENSLTDLFSKIFDIGDKN